MTALQQFWYHPAVKGPTVTGSLSGNTVTVVAAPDPAVAWSWDYGDGTVRTGRAPGPKTYSTPGPHTVTLTTTYESGDGCRQYQTVTVVQPTSVCGAVWETQTLPPQYTRASIAGANGTLVIGSQVTGGTFPGIPTSSAWVEWSADGGATWTPVMLAADSAGYPALIAGSDAGFAAYINAGLLALSPDGVNWASFGPPVMSSTSPPVYGFGGWYIFSEALPLYHKLVVTAGVPSVPGAYQDYPAQAGNVTGASSPTRMVITGRASSFSTPRSAYSTDGVVFTVSASPPPIVVTRLAYGAGLFVGLGEIPTPHTSYLYTVDGDSWTTGTLPLARQWREVLYLPCGFLMSCIDGPELLTSPDGLTWYVLPATHHFADTGEYNRMAHDGVSRFATIRRGHPGAFAAQTGS